MMQRPDAESMLRIIDNARRRVRLFESNYWERRNNSDDDDENVDENAYDGENEDEDEDEYVNLDVDENVNLDEDEDGDEEDDEEDDDDEADVEAVEALGEEDYDDDGEEEEEDINSIDSREFSFNPDDYNSIGIPHSFYEDYYDDYLDDDSLTLGGDGEDDDDDDEDDDDDDSDLDGNRIRRDVPAIPVHELKVEPLPDGDQQIREDYDSDVQDHLCAICFSLLEDPAGCGRCQGRFCRKCLARHYSNTPALFQAGVAKCPTCRNSMHAGIVPDPHYAAFLASEPFTCRYAHCGLRILATQMRRHEALFCQGIRVACKYAPLGCDWKGLKKDAKRHELGQCSIANNNGLLAYAQRVQQAESQLRSRIRKLEVNQANGMRMLQQQLHRVLLAHSLYGGRSARGHHNHNHNHHGISHYNNNNNNNNRNNHHIEAQQQQQQQQRAQQHGLPYKATNPFHLVILTFSALVTPGAIHTRGPWEDLVSRGRERALVHNSLALFPSFLLVTKLAVTFWHTRHHLGGFLYELIRLAMFAYWPRQQDQAMNNATLGDHAMDCGESMLRSPHQVEIEMNGPFSLADWLRLATLLISGGIALASLSTDFLSPISWHCQFSARDLSAEDSEPRPFHQNWMKANFTAAMLTIYYCAIPLVQSTLKRDETTDKENIVRVAMVGASLLYASLLVPSYLMCFLDIASRNGRQRRISPGSLAVRPYISWGNAAAPLILTMTKSVGMFLTSSLGELLDVWYLYEQISCHLLPESLPRPMHFLDFLFQPWFHDEARTRIYVAYCRCAIVASTTLLYFVQSLRDWHLGTTINTDNEHVLLGFVDGGVTGSCPVSSTATKVVSNLAGVVVEGVKSRCVILVVILGFMSLLDRLLLCFGRLGLSSYKDGGARDHQWQSRPILKKVSWPGSCLFFLYLLALKQIWDF